MTLFDPFTDQVRAFSTNALIAAYEKTSGEERERATDDLLAEIRRRELDV